MTDISLTVTGMTCTGCVNSVKNLLQAVPGVRAVTVDLASGHVSVVGAAERSALVAAIKAGGFDVAAAG